MNVITGVGIPFAGTLLGAMMVFIMRNQLNEKLEKGLLGFASGVMIAASVWSLIMPSIDMSEEQGLVPFVPAALGFLAGIFFLLLLDHLIPHLHLKSEVPEGRTRKKLKKSTMLILAVTLHNVPEGMAVGVVFAGAISGNAGVTMAAAFTLAVGIAIQNFPEGAIISMPLKSQGMSKSKSFLYGALSGIVEPISALVTLLCINKITMMLPYLLSFAAGAMIYVVIDELIPESQNGTHSDVGIVGAALGFTIMMVLDVALG